MKWLCTVGVAVSLALQPALADELFGNHPLTPQARDAFVTDLLKKMTVDEKIGQLRLISVGPDNPKEAIREMIKNGQVGAIFNTVTRPDIRVMQDQVMQLSRLKIPLFFAYDVLHGQRTVFPIAPRRRLTTGGATRSGCRCRPDASPRRKPSRGPG